MAGGVGPLGGSGGQYGLVEAGQGNAALLVVQAGQQLGQGLQRVEHGSAEDARVQLGGRAAHLQLGVEAAAQPEGEGRLVGAEQVGIGEQGAVGAQ